MSTTRDTSAFMRMPAEILLLLQPHLGIASLTSLSQCNSVLRSLFWHEKSVAAACLARGITLPLEETGLDEPRPRVPDYLHLCALMTRHVHADCRVRHCHEVVCRLAGECSQALTV